MRLCQWYFLHVDKIFRKCLNLEVEHLVELSNPPEAAAVPWPAMLSPPRLGDPPRMPRPLSAPRTTPPSDLGGAMRSLHFKTSPGGSLPTLPIEAACRMWSDATYGGRSLSIQIRDTLPRLREGENVTPALANAMTVHGVCDASNFGGHAIFVQIRVADMVICAPVPPSRSDRSRSPPRT